MVRNESRRTGSLASGLLLALTGIAEAGNLPLTPTTVVVDPATMNGWVVGQETPGGSAAFPPGPGAPPAGSGSLRLVVDSTGGELGATQAHSGTPLSEITGLAYQTWRSLPAGPSSPLAIALQFDIDYDPPATTGGPYQGRLVFEPSLTPGNTVLPSQWQGWDALAGRWWATRPPGNLLCPQASPCSWAQVRTNWPNAAIWSVGALYLKAGGGWTGGFDGNADALRVTTTTSDTLYDFEPEPLCSAICYVDAVGGDDSFGGSTPARAKQTIGAGVAQVSSGGQVVVAAGTYTENLVVTKPMEIAGAGEASVTLRPAMSQPTCPSGSGSLCGDASLASNVILVRANGVTIHDLTIDGDNPLLPGGQNVGGANVDARNGIIHDNLAGPWSDLVVHHVTIRNVFLRGIYAYGGSGQSLHHNTLANVQGDGQSIALFLFGASGDVTFNAVTASNDAIAANWSRGIHFDDNVVSGSYSGVHSDNSGGNVGTGPMLFADTIRRNSVSNGPPPAPLWNAWGIWVFDPYVAPVVSDNVVTNMDVGLGASGQAVPGVATAFLRNRVDGQGRAGAVGAYVTTNLFGWGHANVEATFTTNTITGNSIGLWFESEDGQALSASGSFNRIVDNSLSGAMRASGAGFGGSHSESFPNDWWGCNAGPGGAGCDAADAGVAVDPWLVLEISAAPTSLGFGGTSTVVQTLTRNSNGVDTSLLGYLPQGIPVAFAATLGSMSPTSASTSNSASSSTFTAGNVAGIGSATATVDHQTVAVAITVNNPAPTLASISPDWKLVGSAGFDLTVTGTSFIDGVSTIRWNGSDRPTTWISATELTATIAPSDVASVGTTSVTVANAGPGGGFSAPKSFDVLPVPPEVWVDDDWGAYAFGTDPDGAGPATRMGYDAFVSVQPAVDAVAVAGIVHLLAGTWIEQVDIGKPLTLRGASALTSILQSPAALVAKGPHADHPVIFVHEASPVVLEKLTVDGDGKGNGGNSRFFGVDYWNAGGALRDAAIPRVRPSAFGGYNGVAVYLRNDDAAARSIEVRNVVITDYDKNGMAIVGEGLSATVADNQVTGHGATSALAQNGIQLSFGAAGVISGNTVRDNACTQVGDCSADPTTAANADGAAGILLYGAGSPVTVSGNTVVDSQYAIWSVGSPAMTISGNSLSVTGSFPPGVPSAGVSVWDCDQWCSYFGLPEKATGGAITTNTAASFGWGVLVRDFDGTGLAPAVEAHTNRLVGNSSFGGWSNTPTDLSFTCNWWNSPSGPTHASNPGGTGDAASDHLVWDPWNGLDLSPCVPYGSLPSLFRNATLTSLPPVPGQLESIFPNPTPPLYANQSLALADEELYDFVALERFPHDAADLVDTSVVVTFYEVNLGTSALRVTKDPGGWIAISY